MSVYVTTAIWKFSEAEGNDRLVLLAIGDQCDEDGGNAWPTIKKLAHRCRLSERTVQRAIATLIEMGELVVEANEGGDSERRNDRRPNRYTVCLPGLRGDKLTPRSFDGVTDLSPRNPDNGVTDRASRDALRPIVKKPLRPKALRATLRGDTPDTPSAGRRDLLWEALMQACSIQEPIPASARGAYNRACQELRNCGATPEDVLRRSVVYRARFDGAALTPTALARHWAECERMPRRLSATEQTIVAMETNPERRRITDGP